MITFAVFVSLLLFYSLISQALQRTVVTPPILFTLAGILFALVAPSIFEAWVNAEVLFRLAEIGLVLLLFADASRTNLKMLAHRGGVPARLLTAGMLLTIFLGAVSARMLFPNLTIWECCILATVLAPTDAGIGQIIVSSPQVPMPIRQALNVEAGLNDGLCVPFQLFFMALAAAKIEGSALSLTQFIVEQLGIGVLIGGVLGLAGGFLLAVADRTNWMAETEQKTGVLALPLLCLVFSKMADASAFIAAFVCGLTVQVGFKRAGDHSVEFAEKWGQVLNLSVFFLFGLVAVRAMPQFNLSLVLYAVLSLTLIRMLPVALALIGTRLSFHSVLFIGWFGPRGLASIVLGLVYLQQQIQLPGESTIRLGIISTVLLSIFAHGLSAAPGIKFYSQRTTPSDSASAVSPSG